MSRSEPAFRGDGGFEEALGWVMLWFFMMFWYLAITALLQEEIRGEVSERIQTWIVGWHPGQLVIAWVTAAIVVLPLAAYWRKTQRGGVGFLLAISALTMLSATWKWFGGRPESRSGRGTPVADPPSAAESDESVGGDF